MVVLPGDGGGPSLGRRVVLTQGGPYLTALLSWGRRVVLTLGGPYLMALLSWGRRVVLTLGGPYLMALLLGGVGSFLLWGVLILPWWGEEL